MVASNAPFAKLLPELFPVVAAHLPLYAISTTLLSLALTNHDIYEIVYPLLYSCLVLRNEHDALNVLQRILVDSQLGRSIRELHIISDLSLATRVNVIDWLRKIVQQGLLPYIHTLGLRLLQGWHVKRFNQEDAAFWKGLRSKCPCLRGVVISGIDHWQKEGWDQMFQDSGPNESKRLSYLVLSFRSRFGCGDSAERLFKSIHYLSPSLHTLVLRSSDRFHPTSCILTLEFPLLKSLTLDSFWVQDTSEAMTFWRRHPSLERLRLSNSHRNNLWFNEDIEPGLLPNLRHFKSNFVNVRPLGPILHQLVSLSIEQSINAQVPYLLRSVIPYGLPHLKSLEIDQNCSTYFYTFNLEGTTWYETPDGNFHNAWELEQASRTFSRDYIHSIARGAPNLEELALHGYEVHTSTKWKIFIQHFAEFTRLERLYFRGQNGLINPDTTFFGIEADRTAFLDSIRALAGKCKSLKTITDISIRSIPYLTAKIRRNQNGEVDEVITSMGYGTQIGSEDDPFPRNPQPIVPPAS